MGQKVSHEKVNVAVSLREGMCRLDTLRVSYRGSGCLGRRRQVASFTFPGTGWWCAEGIAACKAEGGLSVPLAALKKKDGSKTVQLRCSTGRRTLLKATMTLGKFIDNLDFLHFSLHCDGRDSGVPYTSMRCNGHRCVAEARHPMWHQPNGGKETSAPTRPSTTPAGGASDITKAPTSAGDASDITKAPTPAGDVSDITKAATPAGDASDITKAPTPAGDASDITKAATPAGDASDITKAPTPAGDASAPTRAPGNKVDGVKKAGVVVTPASSCEVSAVREPSGTAQDSTHHTLRSRDAKKPKRRARGRNTVIPKRHAAPYTWTGAFLDVTAICAVVVSGVLLYYTYW